MNVQDAGVIAHFVTDLIAASLSSLGKSRDDVKAALNPVLEEFFKHAKGAPGTGICICGQSPEAIQRTADGWGCTFEATNRNLILDHRCPHHGEKAQPGLWGRHKEMVLMVRPAEWLSLGVTR